MSRTRMFIGSSRKNLRAAGLLARSLRKELGEEAVEVRLWTEGVFGLNEHYLESLLRSLDEFDFAVLVLAADDLTTVGVESRPSPRDNVLFESGLFMGVLGRDRVFLVHDQSVELKIPSDLAGITLASYDGARLGGPNPASMRKASAAIAAVVRATRFPHLVGEWRSVYPVTFEAGNPMADEDIDIRACRGGVSLANRNNSQNDLYTAFGRLVLDRQLMGKWKSLPEANDMEGLFLLTISPNAKFMYGYFTSPNVIGGTVYATWVLAKKNNVTPEMVEEHLRIGQETLESITFTGPDAPPSPDPGEGEEP